MLFQGKKVPVWTAVIDEYVGLTFNKVMSFT